MKDRSLFMVSVVHPSLIQDVLLHSHQCPARHSTVAIMKQLHVPVLANPGIELYPIIHIRKEVSCSVLDLECADVALNPTAKPPIHKMGWR